MQERRQPFDIALTITAAFADFTLPAQRQQHIYHIWKIIY